MTEPIVKDRICEACGAEVREGSLFCYNCGEAVSKNGDGPQKEITTREPIREPAPVDVTEPGAEIETPIERKPLQSAASLRKQRRAYNRQPVEITWVRPEGLPKMFIAATVVLTVGALFLLIIALYLR